jgi:ferrous iron transport protein B
MKTLQKFWWERFKTKVSQAAQRLSERLFFKRKNILGTKSNLKNGIGEKEKTIALAGNPNVGKSTVFNRLTGLKQHTGNWPGKTVTNASGEFEYKGDRYVLIDLPGTYSLSSASPEEETARDFICFGRYDAVIVVCDATCLERNLNLLLQTAEITDNVVLCVNLIDEAEKKGITIDARLLEEKTGIPVVCTSAAKGKGLEKLIEKTKEVINKKEKRKVIDILYPPEIEKAIAQILPFINTKKTKAKRIALELLGNDEKFIRTINKFTDITKRALLVDKIKEAKSLLSSSGITAEKLYDIISLQTIKTAEKICSEVVFYKRKDYNRRDRNIDKILTGKKFGIPLMLLFLSGILWLTITGANYPSQILAAGLFWLEEKLKAFFIWAGSPAWLHGALVDGVYRVLAWIVSVMLPPMAIFFPLFTLLEDSGYLPRVAFNLDKYFKKCSACGKQALTMCMGLGCNACGVTGCRIINSPRERLIAIITNSFVPCNGRFPAIIAIMSMFFIGFGAGILQSFLSALLLTAVIVTSVVMTLLASKFLSETFLKGEASSFTLELPPYRKPQFGKVIIRSLFDRTLFVLGRAVAVAAPAGLIIWLTANVYIEGFSLLTIFSDFLNPFADFIGLDGIILLAFILAFPANEIVIPIIIMAYMAKGQLVDVENLSELKNLLIENGWTAVTAVCTIMFSLFHWPCSTTCLTIKKETKSLKWTALSFILPTLTGLIICAATANGARLLGIR